MDYYITEKLISSGIFGRTVHQMRKTDSRNALIKLLEDAHKINPNIKTIVEIGSYAGEGSEIISRFFEDATVYCVDPWNNMDVDIYNKIGKNFGDEYKPKISEKCFDIMHSCSDNIKKLKMTSMEASCYFKNSEGESDNRAIYPPVDLIYIDGIHVAEHIILDLNAWIPKMRKDGILSGHDYGNKFKDYKLAIYNYFGGNRPKIYADLSWMYTMERALNIMTPLNIFPLLEGFWTSTKPIVKDVQQGINIEYGVVMGMYKDEEEWEKGGTIGKILDKESIEFRGVTYILKDDGILTDNNNNRLIKNPPT